MVNRNQQLAFVDAQLFGQHIPREGNGLFLEVIAKAEIAEHFKKGQVAGGIANVIKVVMLAPCPHAFLAGGGAGIIAVFQPRKHVFELHHARIGEHQARVIPWHQGRAFHRFVAVFYE